MSRAVSRMENLNRAMGAGVGTAVVYPYLPPASPRDAARRRQLAAWEREDREEAVRIFGRIGGLR